MMANDPQPAPRVLVLTPVKDADAHLERYIERLEHLDFPREALSLGLLESDSRDETWMRLEQARARLARRCHRVTLLKKDFGFQIPAGIPRWTPAFQRARRQILARARNNLLFAALDDEDWVLWLDVDVVDYPGDLIGRLLAAGRDILHPNCVLDPGGPTFDRNAWRAHGAETLSDLRGRHSPVRLDAVGGTVLFVRADLHRDGLVFPPFPYGLAHPAARPQHPIWDKGEIETEGFGLMAQDMGQQCWGLPDLEVIHARA